MIKRIFGGKFGRFMLIALVIYMIFGAKVGWNRADAAIGSGVSQFINFASAVIGPLWHKLTGGLGGHGVSVH